MDIFSHSWLCLYFIFGYVDTSYIGVPCRHYEVLVCGDADREWTICRPHTPGVNRIISAQLDTRYANRYCRRYGSPENFGLTSSGRAMWTVGWCFGTFFLCLDLDPDYDPNDVSNVKTTYVTSSEEYDIATLSEMATTDSTMMIDTKRLNTEPNEDEVETLVTEAGTLEAEEFVAADDRNFERESHEADNNCTSNTETHALENVRATPGLNSRLKFWLIFGVISGGLVIVMLIGVITYLSVHCYDSEKEDIPGYNSKKQFNEKYFRQQKWSTSALVTSESDYCTDVYDFIPADKTLKKNIHCSECETPDKTKVIHKTNNINATTEEMERGPEQGERIYTTSSLRKSSSCKSKDYFVLIPHNLSEHSLKTDNNNVKKYSHETENTYDHLIHSPTVSVSDDTTYNHLEFQREAYDREKCDIEPS